MKVAMTGVAAFVAPVLVVTVVLMAPTAASIGGLGQCSGRDGVVLSENMQPKTAYLGACIAEMFPQIQTIGGYRPFDPFPDHPSGQALDIMIPNSTSAEGAALGDAIAVWLLQNAESARIVYMGWRGRLWSNYVNDPVTAPSQWRVDNRDGYRPQPAGSPHWTRAHMDHIHVSVNGPVPLGGQPQGTSEDDWKARGFDGPAPSLTNPISGGGSGGGGWVYPLRGGQIGSEAGWRFHPILKYTRCHAGADMGAGHGAPILAASAGVVSSVGWSGGYGNYTKITHGNGVVSAYAHQSSYSVKRGQRVKAGQVIGYVGSTGLSSGPHLHFEIWVNGQPHNPRGWIDNKPSLRQRICV